MRKDPMPTAVWSGALIAESDDVVVGGQTNPRAAGYDPLPREAAVRIAERIAFRRGVAVEP